MSDLNLNLARKWRSKNFDTIVGQDLAIRMLKNSLYRNHYFPVYLFSGQRGCGKTTTARVFAAAINCDQLTDFQNAPKTSVVPCGICNSCQAMLQGKHPDFIEVDAASHTGVDNVRNIIDASSFMPLMGRKKIYLIDEVHMLSKAAFNAFLKILEEPPTTVLFILATTDPQKILETVKSRCFQLFFTPVIADHLYDHLATVCKAEAIPFEDNALQLIIKESEGSVRDALNLLEQVRFSSPTITKQAVLSVLGQLSDEQLLDLFANIMQKDHADVLKLLASYQYETYVAERLWHALVELVRAAVWLKYGAERHDFPNNHALQKIVSQVPLARLRSILELLCDNESTFSRTTKKHLFLEMIILRMCKSITSGSAPIPQNPEVSEPVTRSQALEPQVEMETAEITTVATANAAPWDLFLRNIEPLKDPLLASIFTQGRLSAFDTQSGEIVVTFSEQFSFFQDWLNDTQNLWLPILKSVFGELAKIKPVFTGENAPVSVPMPESITRPIEQKKEPIRNTGAVNRSFQQRQSRPVVRTESTPLDVSDTNKWQKAHLLLKYFPGTISEIAGGHHGQA